MSGWVAGAVVVGSVISSNASKKAASSQAAAAEQSAGISKQISDEQIALQREQFEYQKGIQEPFRQAGVNALTKMQGGAFAQPEAFKFGAEDYTADPGYAFRLSEGQKALDRQAAARGGLISGSALKAATRYGQDMGSQEFQNAYQRALTGYNTDVARSDTGYNRLASLAGVGQTSTDKIGAAGQSMTSGISGSLGAYGNAASDAYMGAANARASGYVGQANAINQGLGTYLNYTQSQNMLNRLSPRTPGYGGSIGYGAGYAGEGPIGYAP